MRISLDYGPSGNDTYITDEVAQVIFDGVQLVHQTLPKKMRDRVSVIRAYPGYVGSAAELGATRPPRIRVIIREGKYPSKEHVDSRPDWEKEWELPPGFTKNDVHRLIVDDIHTQLEQISERLDRAQKFASEELLGFKKIWTGLRMKLRIPDPLI